jgi:hypothetical protein
VTLDRVHTCNPLPLLSAQFPSRKKMLSFFQISTPNFRTLAYTKGEKPTMRPHGSADPIRQRKRQSNHGEILE